MKGMQKIKVGTGFFGVLNYDFHRDDKNKEPGRLLGGNMAGNDPASLAAEFGVTRDLRPDIEKPVWHNSLRLPAGDYLTDSEWIKFADEYMSRMGFSDLHSRCYVLHDDADGQHIHIVASRIALDGSLYLGRNENLESTKQIALLEREFGLTLTKGRDLDFMPVKSKPKKNELEQGLRTGVAPPKLVLQNALDAVMSSAKNITLSAFIERLHAAGDNIYVKPSVASTGLLNGFSFSTDGIVWFKGSKLGKSYSLSGLTKAGLDYEQTRDSSAVIAATERAARASDSVRSRDSSSDARNSESDDSTQRRDSSTDTVVRIEDAASRDTDAESISASHVSTEQESRDDELVDRRDEDSDARTQTSDQAIEQVAQSENDSTDIHHRRDDWRSTADDIADLAAISSSGTMESESLTPAQKAKIDAVTKQLNALNAEQYRLTLISRDDSNKSFNLGKQHDTKERFFTTAEVIEKIPFLSRKNAQKFDIYVTPIDSRFHYIVVDDARDYFSLLNEGFKPSIIQQSSDDNYQAIIKIDKAGSSKSEQSAANKLVQNLNQQFGDEQFSGVIHPFRLAGFSNKKPGRKNAFTTLILAIDRICEKSAQMLAEIRKSLKSKNKRISEHVEQSEIQNLVCQRENEVDAKKVLSVTSDHADLYRRLIKNASNFAEIDMSVIDFRFAEELLKKHSQHDVVNAIIELSPDLSSRHANAQAYAQRTVGKARESLESERRSITRVKSQKIGF